MKNHFNFTNYEPEEFKKHISKSIPNYDGMREMIPSIASNFLVENSNIYDLGCSAGDLLQDLEDCYEPLKNNLSYIGYDKAGNLLPKGSGDLNFFKRDVTEESLTLFNTSLVFSLFTLQFIPLPKRIELIKKVHTALDKRGAFIVCEKIYSNNGFIEDIFTFTNYDMKYNNGFSADEILDKQKDLRNIMFPLTQSENEELFRKAGFKVVEVFFKSLNFIGWILVK